MNAPERAALIEAATASTAMADHLKRLSAVLDRTIPIGSAEAGGPDADVERYHAFLRMFEQLYDVTSRRLFRGLLMMLGEDYRGLAFKAVVRRLEALSLLADADQWLEIGETRNALIHDYPANPTAFAGHLNRARSDLPALLQVHAAMVDHLRAEGLLS